MVQIATNTRTGSWTITCNNSWKLVQTDYSLHTRVCVYIYIYMLYVCVLLLVTRYILRIYVNMYFMMFSMKMDQWLRLLRLQTCLGCCLRSGLLHLPGSHYYGCHRLFKVSSKIVKSIIINNYDNNNNSNDNIVITVVSGLRWSPFGRAVSVSTLYVISFLNFLELKPCWCVFLCFSFLWITRSRRPYGGLLRRRYCSNTWAQHVCAAVRTACPSFFDGIHLSGLY